MFVTYSAKYIGSELPESWKVFISYKSGNMIAFLDNLMNSVLYRDRYDELSEYVANILDAANVFGTYLTENLVECDTFLCLDEIIMKWLVDRLLSEDVGAKLNSLTIPQVCEKRRRMHFGVRFEQPYQLLYSAFSLIVAGTYQCPNGIKAIMEQYQNTDYQIDYAYRQFYSAYDRIEDTTVFDALKELIENIYTNEYLSTLLPKWNLEITREDAFNSIPLQRDFFSTISEMPKNAQWLSYLMLCGMRLGGVIPNNAG